MSPVPVWRALRHICAQVMSKRSNQEITLTCYCYNKYCIYFQEYINHTYIYCIQVIEMFNTNTPPLSPPPFPLSAPCAPQDVDVISQCTDASMVVSWSPNPDAQDFQVTAESNTGARHLCNSIGTACTIENLPCGRNYSVTVLSVRDGCESESSTKVETCSGNHFCM